MQYKAVAKNIKISPRKVRLVADAIKSLTPDVALVKLAVVAKRGAGPIEKVIKSAIANAVNNSKATKENLVIKELYVTEGVTYKRFHFAARGRVHPYKKRTSHITVILEDKIVAPVVSAVKELPAKIEKEEKKKAQAKKGGKK